MIDRLERQFHVRMGRPEFDSVVSSIVSMDNRVYDNISRFVGKTPVMRVNQAKNTELFS